MATIKQINQDFVVNEISLMPNELSGQSLNDYKFTIATMTKEGYTSFEALDYVSKFFSIQKSFVKCQGLKDEDGVTTQLISIGEITFEKDIDRFNAEHHNLPLGFVYLKLIGYSPCQVKEKCLHGNLFNIKIRDLSDSELDKIVTNINNDKRFVCLNYYDSQRFGLPDKPHLTHKIGEALISGDYDLAFEYYKKSGNFFDNESNNIFKDKVIDIRLARFFLASYYSFLWNNELAKNIKSEKTVTIFDDYKLPIVFDTSNKIVPMVSCDISTFDDDWNITVNYKTRESMVYTSFYILDTGEDDLNCDKKYITLNLYLPTGAYATIVFKQFLIKCGINKIIIGSVKN